MPQPDDVKTAEWMAVEEMWRVLRYKRGSHQAHHEAVKVLRKWLDRIIKERDNAKAVST